MPMSLRIFMFQNHTSVFKPQRGKPEHTVTRGSVSA